MEAILNPSLTRLEKDVLLTIRNGQGRCLAVFRGAVWLTQENDPRDIVLQSGDSFTFDRQGVALVHALEATSLVVLDAAPAARQVRYEVAWLRARSSMPVYRRVAEVVQRVWAGFTVRARSIKTVFRQAG